MLPLVGENPGACDVGRRFVLLGVWLDGARWMRRCTAMPRCMRL